MARSVYRDMFAELDPDWPSNPIGPLRSKWVSSDEYSAAYLIHLAQVLWQLSNKNTTEKSYQILCEKVRMLLRPPRDAAYEETLIELEVAASLSGRASPISFEPLVSAALANSPSKPKSPDYALRLPDCDVTIEVTVWHWEALQRWDRMVSELKKMLSNGMLKAGLSGQVSIDLPIRASSEKVLNSLAKAVLEAMAHAVVGELVFDTGAGNARIRWFEIPRFNSIEEFESANLPEGMNIAISGNLAVGSTIGFSVQPICYWSFD